jgi:predicted DNA-binding antitoxin AbrB/MazE fold protein
MVQFEAVYEDGVLRPLGPVELYESERVTVSISPAKSSRAGMIDQALLAHARAEVAGMTDIPTLEELRRQLSSIRGSMAEAVIAERGEY